jgi:HAMP domain-containing protein
VAERENPIPDTGAAAEAPAAPVRKNVRKGRGGASRTKRGRGAAGGRGDGLDQLLDGLLALEAGEFDVRLALDGDPRLEEISDAFNRIAERNQCMTEEVVRVSTTVGREGQMADRATLGVVSGGWQQQVDAVNSLITDLMQPTTEVARVLDAVARGDLTQTMVLEIDGKSVQGEFLRIATTVNTMVDQLSGFASEVTRVAREVGTDGNLGGQARVPGVAGTWKDLTDSVNFMASNLTDQVRAIKDVTTAVANGDLSQKITIDVKGEISELKDTINSMVDRLSVFADEVTRVAREVGTDGKLGGQAQVPNVAGTWKDLTDSVNFMAGNLTDQVRNIALVTTAVANGDLSQKIEVDVRGEVLELKNTINTMVDQLSAFASEVTRVAKEVGTEGKLGGQAEVRGVAGVWSELTENVNQLAGNLTVQLRDVRDVATAIADGDLTRKITVQAEGEILQIKDVINSMVDRLSVFADEVTRVAREVGTEGVLGGQADVPNVGGTWKDLTENVNFMAGNLTAQVRDIALVTTAVANGDLSQKITVDVRGEVLELKDTINSMVDRLRVFAGEVTRVAREVGTEGQLGGQAEVPNVAGTWKDLTDSVNFMASNLTTQVRAIKDVTTAVATGDLSQKIEVDVKGEILELKDTINTMVDQLGAFASEVTRVAREVGTEGKLGVQAEVEGVAGVWRDLTENVNQLAGNLTVQLRDVRDGGHRHRRRRPDAQDHRGRAGRDPPDQGGHQLDGGPAERLRGRGHPRGSRGGHRRGARRSGGGPERGWHVEGSHRLGELHGREPHRAGAEHRRRHHRRGAGRPLPEDHGGREGRDPGAQGHHQHDGGPAQRLRLGGDTRRPGGGHRGGAGRAGRRAGGGRGMGGPDRLGERHGGEPHRAGAEHRRRHHRGGAGRSLAEDHGGRARRGGRAEAHHQHDGGPAERLRVRGDARRPGGRHRGSARRAGGRAGGRRDVEGADRQRELHGEQPDRAGAQHRPGRHGHRQRRPVAEDHGGRARRDPGAEGHHQLDGGPAARLRRRGDARGPRGGHRGPARRSGRGAERGGHLEGPHRERERHGQLAHRARCARSRTWRSR